MALPLCCGNCYEYFVGSHELCDSKLRMIAAMEGKCSEFDPCIPGEERPCDSCEYGSVCEDEREQYKLEDDE